MSDLHEHLLRIAQDFSSLSLDPSTKVGAVIARGEEILSVGYNHIPHRLIHLQEQMNDREWKYPRVVHAEASAILKCRHDLQNSTLYCTHVPCSHCATLIVEVGIRYVFTRTPQPDFLERWPSCAIALNIFAESGVPIDYR